MGKIEGIATFILNAKEVIGEISGFFEVSVSNDYYSSLDKLNHLMYFS